MDEKSDDLITIAESAKFSERSPATIRRWVKAGHLIAEQGEKPSRGGSAPLLVRRGSLVGYLVASGQQPKKWEAGKAVEHPGDLAATQPAATVRQDELAELVELRRTVAKLEADGLRSELARLEVTNHDLRAALADSRETIRAQRAELGALKSEAARGWLDRLFGRDGSARPLLTDEN